MIVSWNWLKQYVRLDMPIEQLVDRLMMSGLNHEGTDDVDGDLAIDLEVTSNRPDCLGHLGVAREVAALFGHELRLPATDFAESDVPVEERTSVTVEPDAVEWCPQYRARVIEGVTIAPSPDWMQRRLRSLGCNPINNVVDITNYVLLECGQPLHAFDYDKLAEHRIVVRSARDGERFVAINNKTYDLAPWIGVIADAKRAVALAGVMGGAESEVTDTTKTVLLETAEFAPISIRRTSRALDLGSESSYRFERKIDPLGVAWASDRACHLLCELAGGKVAKGYVHVGSQEFSREPITLRWSQLRRILGIEIPNQKAHELLVKLGLVVTVQDDEAVVVVPPVFRRDLTREIDLVEEVGRLYGYDAVPEDKVIPLAVAPDRKQDRVSAAIRDCLASCGYCESVTFSFTDAQTLAAVRPWSDAEPLAITHSSRKQENRLRQSTLPSLLRCLRINESRGNRDVELFEMAHVYLPVEGQVLPDEQLAVGLVSNLDIRLVRGHVEALLERLHVSADFVPAAVDGLDPERSAEYRLNGRRVVVFGCVSNSVRDGFELKENAVICELLMAPLIEAAQLTVQAAPVPDQPSIERDFNFVLDESVRWTQVEELVRQMAGPHLERLEFVDLYRGKQVPKGKKSITFRREYRAIDRTLTHEEVDGYEAKVRTAIESQLGGVLR